mgnify:CR=1 FL=1
MSSIEEKIAALEASIAKYEGLFDPATTAPKERIAIASITTAKENDLAAVRTQQTEMMKLSGNSTDCDFHNPAVFYFCN